MWEFDGEDATVRKTQIFIIDGSYCTTISNGIRWRIFCAKCTKYARKWYLNYT